MVDFFKFILTCLWNASSYVFSSGPADAKREEPFTFIGMVGFVLFTVLFPLFNWVIIKHDSQSLRIAISIFISLALVVLYFLIAYCFIC